MVVLSQYVEARQVLALLADTPQRVGYLLKDRVSDIVELAETLRRVAAGGTAIDPEVGPRQLRRRCGRRT